MWDIRIEYQGNTIATAESITSTKRRMGEGNGHDIELFNIHPEDPTFKRLQNAINFTVTINWPNSKYTFSECTWESPPGLVTDKDFIKRARLVAIRRTES